MEGKTTAAVLAACLLVLQLSVQPSRVSGMPPEYDYDKCLMSATLTAGTFTTGLGGSADCRFRCRSRCERKVSSASALAGDGSCRDICLASVRSGTAATATGGDGPTDADLTACVDGCTGYYGRLNAKHV